MGCRYAFGLPGLPGLKHSAIPLQWNLVELIVSWPQAMLLQLIHQRITFRNLSSGLFNTSLALSLTNHELSNSRRQYGDLANISSDEAPVTYCAAA